MGLWGGNLKSRVCSLVASNLTVGTHTAGLEGPLPRDSAGKSAPEDSSAGVVVGAPVGDLSALGWSRSCRLALGCRIRCFQQPRPTCTLVLTGCADCGEGQDPSSDGMCHLWHQGGSRSLNITLTLWSAADGLGLASAEPCLGTREEQGRPGEGARTAASWNFLHRRCVVRMSPGAWAVRVSTVNLPLDEAFLPAQVEHLSRSVGCVALRISRGLRAQLGFDHVSHGRLGGMSLAAGLGKTRCLSPWEWG